jgi:hypothetical protein
MTTGTQSDVYPMPRFLIIIGRPLLSLLPSSHNICTQPCIPGQLHNFKHLVSSDGNQKGSADPVYRIDTIQPLWIRCSDKDRSLAYILPGSLGMIVFLLLGIAFVIAHDRYYNSLNNEPVEG